MPYILDGIPTAMDLLTDMTGEMLYCVFGTCPCGAILPREGESDPSWVDFRAALRFHYMNCARARPTDSPPEDER